MKTSSSDTQATCIQYSPRQSATDTGAAEVQIALATQRIAGLTEHLKVHRKDKSTTLGLTKLVSRRRRLLNYLKNNAIDRYKHIVASLGLRK